MRAGDGVSFDVCESIRRGEGRRGEEDMRREEGIKRDILHLQGCTTLRNTLFSWWEFPV